MVYVKPPAIETLRFLFSFAQKQRVTLSFLFLSVKENACQLSLLLHEHNPVNKKPFTTVLSAQDVFMMSENLVTLDFIRKQEPQKAFKCIADIKG